MATTFGDISTLFHTTHLTKFETPRELEIEWLKISIADYELSIGSTLDFDEDTEEFSDDLDNITKRVLCQGMYTLYLQRELSRVMALNGIVGKDISLTGMDSTKRITRQEYEDEITRYETMLHRLKCHSFN